MEILDDEAGSTWDTCHCDDDGFGCCDEADFDGDGDARCMKQVLWSGSEGTWKPWKNPSQDKRFACGM